MIGSLLTVAVAIAPGVAAEGPSPQLAAEFGRIAAAHRDLTRYALQIDVRYESDSIIPLHAEVQCLSVGHCLRTIGVITIIETPRWSIAVDQQRHQLTVAHRDPSDATAGDQAPDKLATTWLKPGVSATGGELTKEGRHWVVTAASSRRFKADLYVDPRSHLISQLDYQVADSNGNLGHVAVFYTWRDSSRLDPSLFNQAHYIVERGEILEPAPMYADYSITRTDGH